MKIWKIPFISANFFITIARMLAEFALLVVLFRVNRMYKAGWLGWFCVLWLLLLYNTVHFMIFLLVIVSFSTVGGRRGVSQVHYCPLIEKSTVTGTVSCVWFFYHNSIILNNTLLHTTSNKPPQTIVINLLDKKMVFLNRILRRFFVRTWHFPLSESSCYY